MCLKVKVTLIAVFFFICRNTFCVHTIFGCIIYMKTVIEMFVTLNLLLTNYTVALVKFQHESCVVPVWYQALILQLFLAASQLSQTAHYALQLPYTVFGLGQTPNFVETIRVGIPHPAGEVPCTVCIKVNKRSRRKVLCNTLFTLDLDYIILDYLYFVLCRTTLNIAHLNSSNHCNNVRRKSNINL